MNDSSAAIPTKAAAKNLGTRKHDPCAGGTMTVASTNLHFHGLGVPPVCHQDETLKTHIEPGDPPFEYRIQIPRDQPPVCTGITRTFTGSVKTSSLAVRLVR